jgi:pimeloyl-ACP methyl ester carboxylesterase
VDDLDIHFIRVRSKHENALPLIVTHGWPGSIIEQLNIIEPLTNPTAHGGSASDAFHVVIPSLPGYGFSGKPTTPGWNTDRVARAWDTLMKRLGYGRYVSQGGDWGARVAEAQARQAPSGLLGIHITLLLNFPPEIARGIAVGAPAPAGLSEQEKAAYDQRKALSLGYFLEQAKRPQTIGYALTDSPVGLASWLLDHDLHSYEQIQRAFEGHAEGGLTRDAILDNITFTGSPTPRLQRHGCTGRTLASSTRAKWRPCPRHSRSSPARSGARRAVGWRRPIAISSISTRLTKAVTSPRGNSRSSLRRRSVPRSGRCVDGGSSPWTWRAQRDS